MAARRLLLLKLLRLKLKLIWLGASLQNGRLNGPFAGIAIAWLWSSAQFAAAATDTAVADDDAGADCMADQNRVLVGTVRLH